MKSIKPIARIMAIHVAATLMLACWFWMDEWFDLPHVLFGAPPTAINRAEAWEEVIVILVFATLALSGTYNQLRRIKQLEGLIPMCAYCKRIRKESEWQPVEAYIERHSDAMLTHGYCPDCMRENFSEGVVREVETELACMQDVAQPV